MKVGCKVMIITVDIEELKKSQSVLRPLTVSKNMTKIFVLYFKNIKESVKEILLFI